MALDNAEFISELSITDPPGTDPINQGDDHIRTTKRATQQSFPNVNAPVPQTAAQMAQMAIKNEVNSFTQANSFDGIVTLNDVGLHLNSITDALTPVHFRRNSVDRWRWQMENDAGGNDMGLLRFVGGVFQDSPIVFKNSSGFINFNTAAAAFFGQSLRLETAAAASTSVQTGMLFIGGSATLRWSLSRQADDVTGDLVVNRHDGNGTFQDTPFRLAQSSGVFTFANRLDMSEKIRFNNFNSNHGLTWRANGSITWELIAVHSNAPLTRLVFDRYVGGVFQDTPLQLHNDTGHVNMPVLPTGPGTLPQGTLYAKQSQSFAPTELVMGVAP